MKTYFVALVAFLGCFVASGAAAASEEEILTPHKVTITADRRKPFGEVAATIENAKDAKEPLIKSITLTVDGKTFVVPKEQFADLRDPLLQTAEFRWDGGRGSGPWLYLTFQLANADAKSTADRPRVYIRFQNGKLMERSIRQPQQWKPNYRYLIVPF